MTSANLRVQPRLEPSLSGSRTTDPAGEAKKLIMIKRDALIKYNNKDKLSFAPIATIMDRLHVEHSVNVEIILQEVDPK